MCLTIPAKVIKVEKDKALVSQEGRSFFIDRTLFPRLKKGDWVLYTGSYAVKKISASQAKEIRELFERRKRVEPEVLKPHFKKIIEASKKRKLTQEEILYLLKLPPSSKELKSLFQEADLLRRSFLKEFICIHGIIEFSNFCQNNCLYCGLRKDNLVLKRYRLPKEKIIGTAKRAVSKIGYKMLVLQSGFDPFYPEEDLLEIIYKIKKEAPCFIILSLGERSLSFYQKAKKAGGGGILMRFETSNQKLYKKIHPQKTPKGNFQKRIRLIKDLKKMGYYLSTGFLFGLPSQTLKDIASDILFTLKFTPQMPSFGPFLPAASTPYQKEKRGDKKNLELTYKIIAILRILMPEARIPITTAMETINPQVRIEGLKKGANALMFNLTPPPYRKNYQIYSKKYSRRDRFLERIALYPNKESIKMLEEKLLMEI